MKEWLQETHGSSFELLRHFLSSFFESDLITTPGQMVPALIGAFSVFLPWFPLIVAPLRVKYAYLSGLGGPSLYLQAVRADELWLITLMMSAIGFLTAIKWQSVFPGLRDYRSLATLPLRSYQIFLSKLLSLLLVATAVIITLNLFPSLLFPSVSGSRWSINPSLGGRILVHAIASTSGCYFFFFGLVALQGLLLIVFRPRFFAFFTGYLQGFLVPAMMILIVLSFSIQPTITNKVLQPHLASWLPPVWFLGLYQTMLGDSDPQMRALAHRAIWALLIAVLATLATYFVSYHRHRAMLLEGVSIAGKGRHWLVAIPDSLIPKPRQAAVVSFMVRTLAASSQHRTILMGYIGFGLAILTSGILGIRGVVQPSKVIAAAFIYAHVVVLIFLLVGFRHLFSIPTELRANWIFQVTECEGRQDWMAAVDRFVLIAGATVLLLIPFPLEIKLLGWLAVTESILIAAFGLLCFEWIFYSWEKLPFTCSHLPGKFPIWIRALQLFAILGLLAPVNAVLLACLFDRPLYIAVVVVLCVSWAMIHANRMRAHGEVHLRYEESPEPAVISLSLLK